MLDQTNDIATIQVWIDRFRAGDDSARDSLIGCVCDRLTLLIHRMLRGYPGVRRWEETDDVLQNCLIRLDRSLKSVAPATAQDFFRLAATQIRRELIDLARHYSGPEGLGANHQSRWGIDHDGSIGEPRGEASDLTHEPSKIAAWTEFHRRVADLTEEDRELFDVLWYQGLTQAQAATILGVAERTVHRRWIVARLRLSDALGGQLPV